MIAVSTNAGEDQSPMAVTMSDFEDELRSFVRTQSSLLAALRSSVAASEASWLSAAPRGGTVLVDGIGWSFRKHGAGVAFTRTDTGVVVDVHAHADDPALFDLWRLRTYFGSLGGRGVKVVNSAAGMLEGPMEQKIALCLARLRALGTLSEDGGIYRLKTA